MPKIAPNVAPPDPMGAGQREADVHVTHDHDHTHHHTHRHHFEREHENEHEGLSAERTRSKHDPRAHDELHTRGRADTPSASDRDAAYVQGKRGIKSRPVG
jgi:hypothetical protein